MTPELVLTLMAGAGMGMSISGLINAIFGPAVNLACAVTVTAVTFLLAHFGVFS